MDDVEIKIPNNLFCNIHVILLQNVCSSQEKPGERFAVLVPKIPIYVTYGKHYDMIKIRLSRTKVFLLKLKVLRPVLTTNVRGQPLLFGIRSSNIFVLHVFRNSLLLSRYNEHYIFLGTDPLFLKGPFYYVQIRGVIKKFVDCHHKGYINVILNIS